ncbi:MFS transporter [Yimella sp. cx-51]|nr:MFS transporter [Yimella sp. cx-51]MBC9956517.1 MFS transporter [Yimella sp. cx-51]
MKLADSWGVLQHRDFRWFFLASSVNRFGSMMTSVAYAFAVLHVDNSASALSKVLAAQITANVVCALFGGVIADRFSRRVVLQSTYLSSATVLAITAWLLFTDRATVPILVGLGALAGATSAFAQPAVHGLVPQLVPRRDLQQANALMAFVRNSAQFLGPVLGAMLVAIGGAPWALAIDAASFVVSSVLLLPVKLPGVVRADTGIVHELREGWTEFRSRTWLWVIVLAFGAMNAIQSGAILVLGPLVAKNTDTLGIKGWGWVMGAEAAGMLLMSLVLLRLSVLHPLRAGMLGIGVGAALMIVLLGVHPVTVPMMIVAFCCGAGMETFGTGWNVALGERIPPNVLSRVVSYDMVGSFVAMPIGMLLYGALATAVPLQPLLIASGVVYAAIALSTLAVPSIRTMQRLPEHADEPLLS